MIVTDLDGTLLDSRSQLSRRNRSALEALGRRGIVRVVATGRSLYSALRVLDSAFPIDYLAFASGAGVMTWPGRRLLIAHHMERTDALHAIGILVAADMDFMVHAAVPENHRFYFRGSGRDNPDFRHRIERYHAFAEAWPGALPAQSGISQLLVIEPPHAGTTYASLRATLTGLNVIRTTSPLDTVSHWIEIFPPTVSKSIASEWLRKRHCVPIEDVIGVGNDHNDTDLLDWAGNARVVANAAASLRERFTVVASNDDNGFAEAVAPKLPEQGD